MTKPYVLIIEDEPTWQGIFTEIIEDIDCNPVVAASFAQAKAALADYAFVLAIVDMSLSQPDYADRSGLEALRLIARRPIQLPTIVVTGYGTIDLAIETLAELNARHFFRKEEFNRRKFINVIQETITANPVAALSGREHEVLVLMSRGLTNKQIAEALTVSVNTIKKHTQNIFTKLNVDSRAAAVARAFQQDS